MDPSNLASAVKVLDRWHLCQARRRAIRATLPDNEERAAWIARLDALQEVGDVPGALAGFASYPTNLSPRIPDAAARHAAGERFGSGGA